MINNAIKIQRGTQIFQHFLSQKEQQLIPTKITFSNVYTLYLVIIGISFGYIATVYVLNPLPHP